MRSQAHALVAELLHISDDPQIAAGARLARARDLLVHGGQPHHAEGAAGSSSRDARGARRSPSALIVIVAHLPRVALLSELAYREVGRVWRAREGGVEGCGAAWAAWKAKEAPLRALLESVAARRAEPPKTMWRYRGTFPLRADDNSLVPACYNGVSGTPEPRMAEHDAGRGAESTGRCATRIDWVKGAVPMHQVAAPLTPAASQRPRARRRQTHPVGPRTPLGPPLHAT